MSELIAVWGSSGAGKSTVAGLLGSFLSRQKKDVILIDTCITTPQLSVWMPYEEIPYSQSMNSLMREDNLTLEAFSHRLILINDSLSILGFVRGETPINSRNSQREDKILKLIEYASSMADYVIFDCNTNFLDDIYTIKALELSDHVLRVISPDIKGAIFEQSCLSMLSNPKFKIKEHTRIGGCCKSFHSVSLIEGIIGKFDVLLPYCEDIELIGVLGKLLENFSSKAYSEYKAKLLRAISVKEAT